MRLLALAALFAFAACRKSPQAAAVPAGYVRYEHAKPRAALAVPQSWRVLQDQGGAQLVTFLGPGEGKRPFSQSLGLYFHDKGGTFGSIEEYARAQKLAGTRKTESKERDWKGRKIVELTQTRETARRLHSSDREVRRERMALIPAEGGFYLLIASAPEADAAASDDVFTRALDSLDVAP